MDSKKAREESLTPGSPNALSSVGRSRSGWVLIAVLAAAVAGFFLFTVAERGQVQPQVTQSERIEQQGPEEESPASVQSARAQSSTPPGAQAPQSPDAPREVMQPAPVAPSQAAAPVPSPAAEQPLPPLPVVSNMVGPPQLVSAVYEFAARHPEVLRYVPCFCGCENDGHRANHDCFVASRDSEGRVTDWDRHGMT